MKTPFNKLSLAEMKAVKGGSTGRPPKVQFTGILETANNETLDLSLPETVSLPDAAPFTEATNS